MMEYSIERANAYIAQHVAEVNPRYRSRLHAMPPIGWINDPNGLCYYRGQYHLFGQYHPYSSAWGPMHWGHWVSDDLVDWTWKGVVMAPDQPYDCNGIFSGSAVVDGDLLTVMYTGVSFTEEGEERQQQCIAQSTDGIHFTKCPQNPVIPTSLLPEGADPRNFRDPKLFRTEDGYRAIMAARNASGGQLLVYRSPDLISWKLAGIFAQGVGDMLECPDYHLVDGHEILISCVMQMPPDGLRYPSDNPVAYLKVKTNPDKTAVTIDSMGALDNGLDFYAPQAVHTPDGESVLVGWLNGWCSGFPTQKLAHQWCGCMAFPRLMHEKDGHILQTPYPALKNYRTNETHRQASLAAGEVFTMPHAPAAELQVTLRPHDSGTVKLSVFAHGDEAFVFAYDPSTEVMTMERGACGHNTTCDRRAETFTQAQVPMKDGEVKLQVLLDVCTVEAFLQDGETVMSAAAYPIAETYELRVASENGCDVDASVWELKRKDV